MNIYRVLTSQGPVLNDDVKMKHGGPRFSQWNLYPVEEAQ